MRCVAILSNKSGLWCRWMSLVVCVFTGYRSIHAFGITIADKLKRSIQGFNYFLLGQQKLNFNCQMINVLKWFPGEYNRKNKVKNLRPAKKLWGPANNWKFLKFTASRAKFEPLVLLFIRVLDPKLSFWDWAVWRKQFRYRMKSVLYKGWHKKRKFAIPPIIFLIAKKTKSFVMSCFLQHISR